MAAAGPTSSTPSRIAALADQCVMCGLCLPKCPTYAVHRHEGRSPRGRVALARLLDAGAVEATQAFDEDLASCLSCGRCEAACPSQVRFSELMLEARATLARRRAEPWISRLLRWLAARPGALRLLMWAASRVVPSRIARPQGGGWRLLAAIARVIERRSDAFAGGRLAVTRHPASSNAPRVLLLQGCIGSAADRDTVASATRVLRRLGFPVVVAEATLCCGSLARQSGDAEAAARQSRALQAAVRDAQAEVVVACASGCHGGLQLALGAGTRVEDLLSLLERRFADTPVPLGAVGRRVALGVPCSQRTIDGGRAMRALLARVPGLEVHELPEGPGCCGAGGLQMALHPDTASPLRALRVEAVLASDCDTVATSNIGCRLQLEVGLAIDGHQRPVCHPVRIIEASMAAAEAGERP